MDLVIAILGYLKLFTEILLLRHLKAGFITHTFAVGDSLVSAFDNPEYFSALVQLFPVLGIALVLEGRWLVASTWWKIHNSFWRRTRLLLLLFALGGSFVVELVILRSLEQKQSYAYLPVGIHIALILAFVNLIWLPIEELSRFAECDDKSNEQNLSDNFVYRWCRM